ncbi:MAG TPA: hypothetical protein PK052_04755 [Anaerohalosphaeraceae bacterium]|nr:hypothetical protein [Phycisphaerae bacterium]HOK96032.1 hypothetical protein [Anaerohalosphaeraceae bacterium]HOL31271.1 hypothetical protein [Anaerohalosphaeraceae bacterium]HOM76050.1 hypothetical protein [Anaerohalosphaeraceae bacterium]HPC64275.1 hypothetical protein [Anaerohalosphaeraceae bacterium]
MKKTSIIAVLAAVLWLAGCENKELTTCQQDNQTLQEQVHTLQQQLQQAQAAAAEKDQKIEALKAENTKVQTQAMESIKTMMEKQAAHDAEVKKNLDAKTQEAKDLQQKLQASQAVMEDLQKQLKAAQEQLKAAAPKPAEAPAQ